MSRRRKATALAKEIVRRRRDQQDHTSHLTALRNVATAVTLPADPDLPVFAETVRRFGFVPTSPAAADTQLLPIIEQAGAVAA